MRTRTLVAAAGALPVTFHRAFDATANQCEALETLVACGVRRVLTSGGAATALEGADRLGAQRSYMANEANFRALKEMEENNLIVPLVGDFAARPDTIQGPGAIRRVGAYLKEHKAIVTAFYLSNVEQYLMRENAWRDFCANVATLPLDETSQFIRSTRGGGFGGPGGGLSSELGPMLAETKSCAAAAQH